MSQLRLCGVVSVGVTYRVFFFFFNWARWDVYSMCTYEYVYVRIM